MSIYVCSDIHGEYNKFMALLKQVKFGEEDTLYIIGDILDRGPKPLEIVDYIRKSKNIVYIKGNHEEFFLDAYKGSVKAGVNEENLNCWVYCGGLSTYKAFSQRDYEYQESLYSYIKELPLYIILDNYILIHGTLFLPYGYENLTLNEIMAMQNEDCSLWNRDMALNDEFIEGYTVILGHTPTMAIESGTNKIIKKTGKIMIDCGATYGGKLCFFRLDDLKEFYE